MLEKELNGIVTFISDDNTVGYIQNESSSYYFHQNGIVTPINVGDEVTFDSVYYNQILLAINVASKRMLEEVISR